MSRKNKARLSELAIGQSALVCDIDQTAPISFRLQELGLVHGTQVTVLRKGPFGHPIEISQRGYRLCLRKEEAALLTVSSEYGGASC